ncbi:MAG: WYL domain-containing protein [Ignavibacteria bacterium]|nr:WYL domain-containing protein [Ignavibacteria bacterium]
MSNQVRRVIKILSWLAAGNAMTTHEIMNRLRAEDEEYAEVTLRTIQRDINDIEGSGIALMSRNDTGQKQYYLQRNARIIQTLSHTENSALAEHMLRAAFPQLRNVDLQHPTASAGASQDIIATITIGQHLEPVNGEFIDKLIEAITNGTWLRIQYGIPRKDLVVHPQRFIPYIGRVYLAAWDPEHQTYLSLSIDRISQITEEKYNGAPAPSFSIEEFMKNRFGLWVGKPENIVVRVSAELANNFNMRQWHPSQQMTLLPDTGELRITMQAGLSYELISWVMHWTPHIIVEEPAELIAEVRRLHEEGLGK